MVDAVYLNVDDLKCLSIGSPKNPSLYATPTYSIFNFISGKQKNVNTKLNIKQKKYIITSNIYIYVCIYVERKR